MQHDGFTSATEAMQFITGGNAVFTITSSRTGKHFTFKVQKPKDKGRKDSKGFEFKGVNPTLFVKVLADGRNTAWEDQLSIGHINSMFPGQLRINRNKQEAADWPSFRALRWALEHLNRAQAHNGGDDAIPSELTVQHEGACCRCNRPLTDPQSIASGIGPECAKKV